MDARNKWLRSAPPTSRLLNIANDGADVVISETAGAAQITSTRQAIQFGVMKKMKYVIIFIQPHRPQKDRAELLDGLCGSPPFGTMCLNRRHSGCERENNCAYPTFPPI